MTFNCTGAFLGLIYTVLFFRWCYCWSECILNTLIAIDCVFNAISQFDFNVALAFDVTFKYFFAGIESFYRHIDTKTHTHTPNSKALPTEKSKTMEINMRFVHIFKGVHSSKSAASWLCVCCFLWALLLMAIAYKTIFCTLMGAADLF